jgi:hypothetical protein
MMISTDNYFRAISYILRRNPVLTAMIVSSLVLGITALIAAIAVWRVSSSCSIPRKPVLPYLVFVEETVSRADVQIAYQFAARRAMDGNDSG